MAPSAAAPGSESAGRSQRIYWQQWISQLNNSNGNNSSGRHQPSQHQPTSRRELITSSASVRMAANAQAYEVTDLLRRTLKLSSSPAAGETSDALVLVGTLHSLPASYVQFAHEINSNNSGQQHVNNGGNRHVQQQPSQPYHTVRTLQNSDHPLQIRAQMEKQLQHLQKEQQQRRQTTINTIAPKFQWFFVPDDATSLIPNCLELDGYCSSDVEEDGDDAEQEGDDDPEDDHVDEQNDTENPAAQNINQLDEESLLLATFPFLSPSTPAGTQHQREPPVNGDRHENELQSPTVCTIKQRNHRLAEELTKSIAATATSQCLSGYLLKRSRRDRHVWRRHHCVLTYDYLWLVSRLYSRTGQARYARIRLSQALLIQPSPDYAPLFRTPFCFEVVTGKGQSFVFRASSKTEQNRWIRALKDRTVESFENSLLEHADLIAADECRVRMRRLHETAVSPLWKSWLAQFETRAVPKTELPVHQQGQIGGVLRWGIQVASYRETCRYIASLLPAKCPVVVSSNLLSGDSSSRNNTPQEQLQLQQQQRSAVVAPEEINGAVRELIASTWMNAAELLVLAESLASSIRAKRSRSVETQCQHIDYLIHGRFRGTSSTTNHTMSGGRQHSESTEVAEAEGSYNTQREPPPADLFDHLLILLQTGACRAVAVDYGYLLSAGSDHFSTTKAVYDSS